MCVTQTENRSLKQELEKLKKNISEGEDPEKHKMREELKVLKRKFEKVTEIQKENVCLKEELKK